MRTNDKRLKRIYVTYQRCKEITRLGHGNALQKVAAGAWASAAGLRLYLCYKLFRPVLPEALDGKGEVLVSLTSFPPRMKNLWMVIDTLMRQESRPAGIILCLSEKQFPGKTLPASLAPYLERGLSVIWTADDLKPHKKYRSVFEQERAGKKRLVVTVDDDVFYSPDTLSRLLRLHSRYPDAVCGNMVKHISGRPYREWPVVTEVTGPSADLLAVGCGAVLYPASVYSRDCFYDTVKLKSLALMADDLWLRYCERKEGIGVVAGPYKALPPAIPSSQRFSLASQNVSRGRNDRIWAALNREG